MMRLNLPATYASFIESWRQSRAVQVGLTLLGLSLSIPLIAASHPEVGGVLAPWLSWLGLTLLLSIIKPLSPWKSAGAATLSLALVFRLWLQWMALSPYLDPLAELAATISALVLASSIGLWVSLLDQVDLTRYSRRLYMALTWCVIEWSRQFWFCGFPWYPLGISWLESWAGIYSWLGPMGSSLPLVLASLEIVYASNWKSKCLGTMTVALGCIALVLWSPVVERTLPVQAAILHSELPVHHFHTSLDSDQIARALMRHLPEIAPKPEAYRLLLTPEGLFPDSGSYFQLLEREGLRQLSPGWLARAFNGYLFMGVEDDCTRRDWVTNSLWVFSPRGSQCMAYAKRQLIPFAEYFPMANWPLLGDYVRTISRSYGILDPLNEGFEHGLFDLPTTSLMNSTPGELRVALSICFEETFPSHILELRQKGAQLWLSLSNDGWYPMSELPREHAMHARILSASLGMPLLRSTQLGLTGVIDAKGRWVKFLGSTVASAQELQTADLRSTNSQSANSDPSILAFSSNRDVLNPDSAQGGAMTWLPFDGELEVLATPFSKWGNAVVFVPWLVGLLGFIIRSLRRMIRGC